MKSTLKKVQLYVLGTVLALTALIVIIGTLSSNPEDRARRRQQEELQARFGKCEDNFGAKVMADRFVKEQLVSPSSARFLGHDTYKISKIGKCSFRVIGQVDSSNQLGAQLRSTFAVELEYLIETDKWHLINISLS